MFSCVTLEQRVPGNHPLRGIQRLTDAVLGSLSVECDQLYAASGRPSIAPGMCCVRCCCRRCTQRARIGVRGRMLAAEVMLGLRKLDIPGFDLAQAKHFLTAASEAVSKRDLGYILLAATKPHQGAGTTSMASGSGLIPGKHVSSRGFTA